MHKTTLPREGSLNFSGSLNHPETESNKKADSLAHYKVVPNMPLQSRNDYQQRNYQGVDAEGFRNVVDTEMRCCLTTKSFMEGIHSDTTR